ncbi:MAG: methyltransferase domain-containing protein [Candidatus Methanomethylophilus sp.]|jgi:ubiquinone/menaquinone biosynthesis C-methylase UbiE|uniref:class I SAM-dependent methyltransferase n=1 Tax=Methanoculleus bourgensis TaxID=83986 RepID=UPI0022EDBF2E|nr:methyltransferase domain-containing protein [Methanoculleus bourgensis]MDD4222904.1 methyltransferase domain-containing protein [Methanomethylophilus sp.]GLI47655.1 ubiquinone biosynthesis protein [Methanoculleus bourgensis]
METDKLELDEIKDGVRKYWDYGSRFYDTAPGYDGDEERSLWKDYLSQAIGLEPKEILDVGTGTGAIALLLAELGHNVTGVDFSREMMEVARKKALDSSSSIRFLEGDVENLRFEDATFDCVTGRYVLWTMTNPEKAVREWVRVVKPGGMIVIIDGKWVTKGLLPMLSAGTYHIYRFIRCGKNPFAYDYTRDISAGLPNPHGVEKEQIVAYMSGAGVTGITVTDLEPIRAVQRKRLPRYMKYANDHPTYLVSGITPKKPQDDGT